MIQESIRQLCAVSIFCGAAINITPEGGVRRIMQLLCTAALTMAILSPIKEIDFDIYALETARLREAESAINESAERIDGRLNRAVIEEQCEEYILDKAEELGANVSGVKVQAQWNLDGLWVPYSAEIDAPDIGSAAGAVSLSVHYPYRRGAASAASKRQLPEKRRERQQRTFGAGALMQRGRGQCARAHFGQRRGRCLRGRGEPEGQTGYYPRG